MLLLYMRVFISTNDLMCVQIKLRDKLSMVGPLIWIHIINGLTRPMDVQGNSSNISKLYTVQWKKFWNVYVFNFQNIYVSTFSPRITKFTTRIIPFQTQEKKKRSYNYNYERSKATIAKMPIIYIYIPKPHLSHFLVLCFKPHKKLIIQLIPPKLRN